MTETHIVDLIDENTAADFAWRRLRRFQDVSATAARLSEKREIPKKHKENVQKQMRQMAYSLTQAFEFAESAKRSGLATRGLQAYYSMTALANAEILWRGDGMVSLERRPNTSKRHGLEFSLAQDLASCIATPLLAYGKEAGLFGLWRQFSRHFPHVGRVTTHFPGGTSQWRLASLSGVVGLSEIDFDHGGLTLMECFAHIPGMQRSLPANSRNMLAQGLLKVDIHVDEKRSITRHRRQTVIHPCSESLVDRISAQFTFQSALCEVVKVVESGAGLILVENLDPISALYRATAPETFSYRSDSIYFLGDHRSGSLNEFGYFLVGLYIISMLSRYHPHIWGEHLSRSSEIVTLCDELVDLSLQRAALLVLGQIEDRIYVCD